MIETIGAFVIALVGAGVPRERDLHAAQPRLPHRAVDDPWDGRSLEWSIPSPPPEYNFAEIPHVEARDDWWHRKYTEDAEGRLVRLPAGGAIEESDDRRPSPRSRPTEQAHGIHMPSPSFYPLVVAAGLPFLGYAAVFLNPWLAIPACVLVLFGVYAWGLEPGTEPGDRHGDAEHCLGASDERRRRERAQPRHVAGAASGATTPAQATPHTGRRQPEARDVAVPVVRLPVLRRVHLHVPALPRPRRAGGAHAGRRVRHPVHVGHVVHPADEQPHDGARARGDPARRPRRFRIWIIATALFGATFIGGQIFEFTEFTREGLNLDTSLFGSSFFVLTGLHGAHVTVGIVWLLSLWGLSSRGG